MKRDVCIFYLKKTSPFEHFIAANHLEYRISLWFSIAYFSQYLEERSSVVFPTEKASMVT